MKKLGIALLLSLLVVSGCTSTSGKKKSKSSSETTSESTSSSSGSSASSSSTVSSSSTTSPSNTSSSSSKPTSSSQPTSSTSSSSQPIPPVTLQKIGTILSERKIGEIVSFQATYLRKITLNNDAVLMFADETGNIGFRCTTTSDYINNTYRFHECKVTGKLVETANALELAYDSSVGDLKASVIRLDDEEELSYDEFNTTLPKKLNCIADIKNEAALLVQDNKYNAYGGIVRFTAQYANYEDDNSKQKTMFVDGNGESIVIIQDNDPQAGHKLTPLYEVTNIGKWYELTGIISILRSITSILAWTCTYVEKTPEEEQTFEVGDATNVTSEIASEIYKGNLTTDHFKALSHESYFKLYHAEGWFYDDGYNDGFTLIEGGTIPTDGTNTRKGFYLVNGDKYEFGPRNSKIDIYFKIESYNTSKHIWKIFVIESLLPEV